LTYVEIVTPNIYVVSNSKLLMEVIKKLKREALEMVGSSRAYVHKRETKVTHTTRILVFSGGNNPPIMQKIPQ